MFKKVSLLLAIVATVAMLSSTAFAARKVINGIDANYPPFAYVDKSGEPAGFDVDALNWIAKEMGFTVEHKPMEWSTIVQSTVAKKIDMVMSGMTITPERAKMVTFSKPYWTVANVFIAKKENDLTFEKIINSGAKLGMQSGTSETEWLLEEQKKQGWKFEPRYYDSAPLAVQDVLNGRIPAAAMNLAPAEDAIHKGKPVVIVSEFGKKEEFGVAVRKDDKELLDLINKGLTKLMADPYWEVLKEKHIKTAKK